MVQVRDFLLTPRIAWIFLLITAWCVYFPGLSGPFLFDDYPNLSSLGLNGGVVDWYTFQSFVFGGFSGPTGRPISLLTFVFNSTDWPADPFSFKATNVVIHLINGTLVFLVTKKLILSVYPSSNNNRLVWLALISASIWMLHPYLVSTTLYVVQRMALLASLFCFLGMYSYLKAREIFFVRPKLASLWMTISVSAGTILATFSKENGAVLPLLILITESTILTRAPVQSHRFRIWRLFFLVIPSVLLMAYLIKIAYSNGFFVQYDTRGFSPYERLLTQSRVVLSYLESWFLPSFSGGILFYDDIAISKGITRPLSTLVSVGLLVITIFLSVFARRRAPLWAFAFLFYLGSQVIESTTIGLELKFDHRIYLGSAFLATPFLCFVANHFSRRFRVFLALSILGTLSLATYSSATLWGDYRILSLVWADKAPQSVRAQIEAAQMLYNEGRASESLDLLNKATDRIPGSFRLRLTKILVECRSGGAAALSDKTKLIEISNYGPYRHTDFGLLQSFFEGAVDENCLGVTLDFFNRVVTLLQENSKSRNPQSVLYAQLNYYRGLGLLRSGERSEGLAILDEALAIRSSLHMQMNVAANKATVGLYTDALTDARKVANELESGNVHGRAAVEAPNLQDVYHFIEVVKQDLSELEGNQQ